MQQHQQVYCIVVGYYGFSINDIIDYAVTVDIKYSDYTDEGFIKS